jgi:hypothetical protein
MMSAEIETEPATEKLPTGDRASAYFSPLGATLRVKACGRTLRENLPWSGNAEAPDGERDILTTFAGLRARPTIVIVAHRPETSALCGQVICLSQQHLPLIEERDQVISEVLA